MNDSTIRRGSCAAWLVGGLVLSSLAFASEDWKPGGSVEAHVKMMDRNGDGKVSPDEHAAGAKTMFAKLDADKDGNVTAAEMDAAQKAAGGGGAGMSSADKIKVIDGDGDGKLSAAEHEAGSHSMFDKTDANKDGSIDAAEIKAAHEAMMGKKDGM